MRGIIEPYIDNQTQEVYSRKGKTEPSVPFGVQEAIVEKIRYIHYNPVKKGLVQDEEEYPFSSANPKYEQFLFKGW